MVLGLAESSNEVQDLNILSVFLYRRISYAVVFVSSTWEIVYIRAGWRVLPYIAYTKTVAGDSVCFLWSLLPEQGISMYASSIQVLDFFFVISYLS